MFWFKKRRKLDMAPLFWVAKYIENRADPTWPSLNQLSRSENETVGAWCDRRDIEQVLRGTDIRKSIVEIIKAYPTVVPLLKKTIESKYPQHLDYLEKLLVLM